MGNQPRPNFNAGEYSGFQHGQNYNQQQGQWRSHPGNQFNKDQGGPSNRPQQQGPSLYGRMTKLEETLAQFMQVSMSNHKSTESAIKNLKSRWDSWPNSWQTSLLELLGGTINRSSSLLSNICVGL